MYISRVAGVVLATSIAGMTSLTSTTIALAQDAQEGLTIYFPSGSAAVPSDQDQVLDQAARLFRDGDPIVMIVSGVADTVGAADNNLRLSILRAQSVADGLTARGIPADRLQVNGRGNSELEIDTDDDTANRENRVAKITWR